MADKGKGFVDSILDAGERVAKGVGQNLEGGIAQHIAGQIMNNVFGGGQNQPFAGPPPQSPPVAQGPAFYKQPTGLVIDGFRENLQWLPGGNTSAPNNLTLAVPTDHFIYSEIATVLNPAEFFAFNLRVISIDTGGKFPHRLSIQAIDPTCPTDWEKGWGWLLDFSPAGQERLISSYLWTGGDLQASKKSLLSVYKPDAINQGLLTYDGKYLSFALNRVQHDKKAIIGGGKVPIKFGVTGMEVCIWG